MSLVAVTYQSLACPAQLGTAALGGGSRGRARGGSRATRAGQAAGRSCPWHPCLCRRRGDVSVLGHSQALAAGTHMPRTHQGVNVERFLVQGAMSDARAASLGLFSPLCWEREGGMGQRQSCCPVFAVRLFLVILSMVFLLWRH